nr:hypothetical protein [uncultured Flavonifractor sp.]
MELDNILSVISAAIAFSAVCVSLYAVRQSRQTALTGTYFSEMAQAYSEYLRCVSEFAFRRGLTERDALAAALYRLQLFASRDISVDAQRLYVQLLDWASSHPSSALELDGPVNEIGDKMRRHLDQARRHGRP